MKVGCSYVSNLRIWVYKSEDQYEEVTVLGSCDDEEVFTFLVVDQRESDGVYTSYKVLASNVLGWIKVSNTVVTSLKYTGIYSSPVINVGKYIKELTNDC